jgi:hypothetical protein
MVMTMTTMTMMINVVNYDDRAKQQRDDEAKNIENSDKKSKQDLVRYKYFG